jgi:hypothetical protein
MTPTTLLATLGGALLDSKLFEDKEIDVSAHLGQSTTLTLTAIALVLGFFVVRPELWKRMFFDRLDPRPAAIMRIVFGAVVLWTFVDLMRDARFLFTDEGMWLTKMARKNYGGKLTQLYDPEHGFEHWYDIFIAMGTKFSILHLRSDPKFVYWLYAVMLASITLMILGVYTRVTTVLSWILVEQVYRYSPLFYTGGDTVVRVFMFLGMFCRWGEAYSIDNWRRNRRAILGGATALPPLRRIPAWPQRLMMLQLAIIYCATGLLKSGGTWMNGTALYYSLCLDHFYRMPEQINVATFMQYIGVLPVVTVFVRWWELLFPVVLIGMAVNCYERERRSGVWPQAPAWRRWISYLMIAGALACGAIISGWAASHYIPPERFAVVPPEKFAPLFTGIALAVPVLSVLIYFGLRRFWQLGFRLVFHWLLGRRLWLIWGFFMHIGIDLGMNVGTFAEVMMAAYFAWPSGDEVDRAWRYLMSRPAAPGEFGRPVRKRKIVRWIRAPFDRLAYRAPGKRYTIHHHPDETSVRHAALLRLWDLGYRLEFVADPNVASRKLVLAIDGQPGRFAGAAAGRMLLRILPGLWWLRPVRRIPVLGTAAGALAVILLRQRP